MPGREETTPLPMNPYLPEFDPSGGSLFSGQWSPRPASPALPGLGSLGVMGGLGLQLGLQMLTGSTGNMAFMFGGDQRFLDVMQAQANFRHQQQAMQFAAHADMAQMRKMMEGAATMAGADAAYLGRRDVQEAMDRLAQGGSSLLPFLATMMPEATDRMFGVRGSATVLGAQVFQAGRYLRDPAAGTFGFSGESAGKMAESIYRDLYGQNVSVYGMKGIGAGELGSLYNQMALRGLASGPGEERGLTEALGQGGPEGARTFQTDRVKTRLKEMAGAVAAIREVFGDMGRPDAPMRELLEGLQALTQGGLQQLQPERIAAMVRQTHELARMTGVDMGTALGLTARGAASAEALGLNRLFGVQSTQGALGFAQGLNDTGMANVRAFGALDKDSLVAMDQQLRNQAANSAYGRSLGAVLALEASYGGTAGWRNSQLAQIASLARSGNADALAPLLAGLSPDRLGELAGQITPGARDAALMLFNSPQTTQQYLFEAGGAGLIRRMQRADVNMWLSPAFQGAFGRFGDRAAGLAARAVAATWGADMTALGKNKPLAILEAMGDLGGLDRNEVLAALTSGVATFESSGRFSQGLVGLRQLFDDASLRRGEEAALVAKNRGELAGALAGVGRGGFVRNLVDFAMTAKPDAKLTDFLAQVGGGAVNVDKVREALTAAGGGAALQSMQDYLKLANDPGTSEEARKAKLEEVRKMFGQTVDAWDRLMTPAAQAGLSYTPITPEQAMQHFAAGGRAGPINLGDPKTKALQAALTKLDPTEAARLAKAFNVREAAQGMLGDLSGLSTHALEKISPHLEAMFGGGAFKDLTDVLAVEGSGDRAAELRKRFGKEDAKPQEVVFAPGTKVTIDGKIDFAGNLMPDANLAFGQA